MFGTVMILISMLQTELIAPTLLEDVSQFMSSNIAMALVWLTAHSLMSLTGGMALTSALLPVLTKEVFGVSTLQFLRLV